jgi:hypothetical protein
VSRIQPKVCKRVFPKAMRQSLIFSSAQKENPEGAATRKRETGALITEGVSEHPTREKVCQEGLERQKVSNTTGEELQPNF